MCYLILNVTYIITFKIIGLYMIFIVFYIQDRSHVMRTTGKVMFPWVVKIDEKETSKSVGLLS